MVKYVVFAVVALFALQCVTAKPKAKVAEKSQLEELAASAQSIVNNVKNNQGEIDTVLKQVSDKLSETAAKLKASLGPEGQKQAKEIKASLDKGLKEAVDQAEKLSKAIEPEAQKVKTELTNAAKTLLDQIVEVSNNLQKQVKATLDEKH
ncbi:hypothetical protein NQ314_011002 [Rhamnusium bicolor]|uniref:Apolipophorin-III n=1 Tax=Rhamnusium bicolor TaxID=1586634 RepID=A0AAV8XLK0_9CUCU|nr:hypothetical protein NQ314_011002 [Rhamnusium bicolor]